VDDKAITKRLCEECDIPVPQTYALIETFGAVRRLDATLGDRPDFVIKPGRGAAGRGVLVVLGREGDRFRTARGDLLSVDDLRYHVADILSGLFSLEGHPDRALVEERLDLHPAFGSIAVGGAPDVRIIVFRGEPAMAMLRLPTRMSGGRANLHQGAVGVGVDLATGVTRGGVWLGRPVDKAPDTGVALAGVQVPHWDRAPGIAAFVSRAVELGYVGVDLVIDSRRGPVVLEANARPGLAVQIANDRGLLPDLAEAERRLLAQATNPAAGV
jgi:alpha-L-glutamate ligase-like protein